MADMDVDTPAPAQEVVKKAKGKDSGKARFEVKKVGGYHPLLFVSSISAIRRHLIIYTSRLWRYIVTRTPELTHLPVERRRALGLGYASHFGAINASH